VVRTRPILLLLIALWTTGSERAAQAGPTRDLAEWLDGDAAAAFRIDAAQIEEGVDFYRRSGMPGAKQAVFVASAASTALLGFDVLTARSWLDAGFDSGAPILGSVAAIDDAAVAKVMKRGGKGAEKLYWRTRILLGLSDRKLAEATLRKLAGLSPGVYEVSPANAAIVGMLFGAPAKSGPAVVRALRKQDVLLVGRVPLLDQLFAVHLQGDIAVVDFIENLAGSPIAWRRDRKPLLALLARKPAGRGLAARLGSGAAKRLTETGSVLWLEPTRLLAAARAFEASQLLRTSPKARIDPASVPATLPVCADLRGALASGPFVDMAITTRLHPARGGKPGSLRTRVDWGLRTGYALGAALLIENDGLIDVAHQVEKRDAVAAGALYLRSLQPLRALPRPTMLQGNLPALVRSLRLCGARRATLLALFAWPQLAGQMLDEIAAVHPQAKTLVESARNTAVAIKRAATHQRDMVAAFETSFSSPADPLIQSYFDAVWGKQKQHKAPGRSYLTWGHGPIRPYRWQKSGLAVFGFGLGSESVRWYLAGPPPSVGKPAKVIGELHLRPPELLAQLVKSGSGFSAAAAKAFLPLAAQFPRGFGMLRIDGDVVRASMVWQMK